ncbi:TPM domain-containing protein [Bifidobacterium platyrrhinorum]|nr:TPM domain-containing protein [Bifidobacterium platyrrhinorum]
MAADSATLTDSITDTQNLLGSNVSAVTDRIKKTEEKTGVHVRLMYVDSFQTKKKTSDLVCAALESTDPAPNTVLLAVASGDGSLAVCVSRNSDEWLRDQKTVDALSDAAMQPLTKQGEQDWSGAAIAMMEEIEQQKQTSTTSGSIRIGVIVMGGVLAVLVVVIVVTVIVRRRREVAGDAKDVKDVKDSVVEGPSGSADGSDAPGEDATSEGGRPMTRRELREARKRRRGPFRR